MKSFIGFYSHWNSFENNVGTEVDDGESGGVLCNGKDVDDRLDKFQNQPPVVAARRVVVTNRSTVVKHKRYVRNTCWNIGIDIKFSLFDSILIWY